MIQMCCCCTPKDSSLVAASPLHHHSDDLFQKRGVNGFLRKTVLVVSRRPTIWFKHPSLGSIHFRTNASDDPHPWLDEESFTCPI